MNRRAVITLALVAILSTSPAMVLNHNQQNQGVSIQSISNSIFTQDNSSSGYLHYTVFVPGSQPIQNAVKSTLHNIGLYPAVTGSLWNFKVPTSNAVIVNRTLDLLEKNLGVSYFSSPNETLTSPSIQVTSVQSSTSIPFAYTPNLISRAYDFNWALSHGINGSGQTIVIVDAFGDPNLAYDIKAFDAVNGLPPVNLKIDYPYGTPGQYNATWAMETATDVEWAHSLAPGARIVLMIATSAYTSYLQQLVSYAVQNRAGNILSLSWGTPETQLGSSALHTYSLIYRQAATEGISVFAASGDNGAYDGTSSLTVNYPASDPYVTAVGGTSLYVLNNNFHQYGWGGVNNGNSYGSGGGFSNYFTTPYWQQVKGYNGTYRGVPDVAMDADRYTGVYVISGGGQYIVGGTSVSTPMWADVAALLRQSSGIQFGSLDPLLYQIARTNLYNSSFTQILSGTNGYYNNTPYWNPVTGLGTPKVSGLVNASKEITGGYGGIVILNGTPNYNSTYVRAILNLAVNKVNLLDNGSTFYYISLYRNQYNYAKFGILAGYSSERLMLMVEQSGTTVTSYYSLPAGYSTSFSNFLLEIDYTGSSISISSSGGFNREIPFFLNFSGEMSPAYGVSQLNAFTNLTIINPATFNNAQTYDSGSWHNASYQYYKIYSSYPQQNFSSIGTTAAASGVTFHYSDAAKTGLLEGTYSAVPQIEYSLKFGSPIEASFSLAGVTSPVSWNFNGTPIKGYTVPIPSQGGIYDINATYVNNAGQKAYVDRTAFFPRVGTTNLTVNYTDAGPSLYTSTVRVMWFYTYNMESTGKIPILGAYNQLNLTSHGFYPYGFELSANPNISINLRPVPVNVTVFSFNEATNITIDGNSTGQIGGYHYRTVLPDGYISVNISAPGFGWSNYTVATTPGKNITMQATLLPDSSNDSLITGTVTDRLFSFPVENAVVRISNGDASYTNSTGQYELFVNDGRYSINATANLYDSFSTPLNVSSNMVLNIQLSPSKIQVKNVALVTITHNIPLLFYLGFVSWTDYKGGNFSMYQIYVSNNDNFLNPTVMTVTSQNTSYRFLTGMVPGHTYYVSVVLRLSDNQVYQSQVVKITYNDPVYLALNILFVGAIGFYIFMAYRIFVKKKE